MMERAAQSFFGGLYNTRMQASFFGQLEFTYRCNLKCSYCYCQGSEDLKRELATGEWKKILDVIKKAGCLWLCFSGGDPLVREDFLELYSYAKAKGFIIIIFTNGQALEGKIIDYLVKSPPYSIEITLNGVTKDTYESITQVKGSFFKIMRNIKTLAKKRLKIVLKTNWLRQNKHEIVKIRAFAEVLFGGHSKQEYSFKYDPMIYPRLNGDKTPLNFRLSAKEILEIKKQDPYIWKEHQRNLDINLALVRKNKDILYRCTSWKRHFVINPYGRLKFCGFSDKFSSDLKITSFKEGFYKISSQIQKARFKTDSKCRTCYLKPVCHYCPAKACLETGDEEAPVSYFCELANQNLTDMKNITGWK